MKRTTALPTVALLLAAPFATATVTPAAGCKGQTTEPIPPMPPPPMPVPVPPMVPPQDTADDGSAALAVTPPPELPARL